MSRDPLFTYGLGFCVQYETVFERVRPGKTVSFFSLDDYEREKLSVAVWYVTKKGLSFLGHERFLDTEKEKSQNIYLPQT